jgi:glycosyltransferase involved in cell wall biosynthesis
MSKNIGFILEFFPPNKLSSAILPYQIAEHFLEKGHKVTILTSKEKNDQTFNSRFKSHFKNAKLIRFKYFRSKKNKFSKILSMLIFFIKTIIRINKFKRMDYVFIFSNPPINALVGYLINKIYHVKVVFVTYDFYPDIAYFTNQLKSTSMTFKFFESLNRANFRGDNKVVVLSNDMKDYLTSKFPIFKDNIIVISNWYIDSNDFKIPLLDSKIIKVGYFGNMGVTQDIEAIKKLLMNYKNNKMVEFNFAIHGNQVEELKSYVMVNNLKNTNFYPYYLDEFKYHKLLNEQNFVLVTLNKNIQKVASPSRVYSFLMAGKPIILSQYGESQLSIDIEKYELGYLLNLNNGFNLRTVDLTKKWNSKKIREYVLINNEVKISLNKYSSIIE